MSTFLADVDWSATALAATVAFVVLLGLVRGARAVGLADDGSDAPARKTHARAVALAGGPALFAAAIALAVRSGGFDLGPLTASRPGDPASFERVPFALALALAFATGLVDDVRRDGLGPLAKLAGQTLAGLALASGLASGGIEPSWIERALTVLAAVVAQNVANTWDHADGLLGSSALAAFAAAGSAFSGALAAFLGFNLSRPRRGGPPHAFVGDSGSHLLGVMLVASPLGLAALTLPAIDLARVVVVRARAGDPVWRGDRRHLGHRLGRAGRGPLAVVAIGLACSVPAFAALAIGSAAGRPRFATWALGAVACALLLALALRLHPEPERLRSEPEPRAN